MLFASLNSKLLIKFSFILFLVIIFSPTLSLKALAVPPGNFVTTQVLGSGLGSATALEFAPDGRLFILQQTGEIKIYKNGALLPRDFDQLPALADGDRGLLGIAFDPDFNTNHYIYFYYIGLDTFGHVVRFNALGDIGTDGPTEIYTVKKPYGSNHAGGTIQFGPDKKLYISIGDAGNPLNSQDLNSQFGKILRINSNGSVPSDNPFVGQPNKFGEIWAYGFRNPFRFQFDSVTGILYVGDVGDAKWEEVNLVTKGGNYGWPNAEGACSDCPYINPIYTYFHNTSGYSITMGPMYHGAMFPDSYKNRLFFGDYAQGFLKTMSFDLNGNQNGIDMFDPGVGTMVDLKVGPDGALYYITIYPGKLYKVSYNNGNLPPTAVSSSNKTSGQSPLAVQFSSAGSNDPENATLSLNWDFGDGTTSNDLNPSKVFTSKGTYTIQLTVSDGVYTTQASPIIIQVGIPPTLTISDPIDKSTYKAGDTINYSSSAQDEQANDIPVGNFTTEVVFHHNNHLHPFLRPFPSKSGGFKVPQTGEVSSDTWYEIKIKATDSNGLTSSKSVFVYPLKSSFKIDSNPIGFKIGLDGSPLSAPLTIDGVIGFQRTLDALIQQKNGNYYELDHWSDRGSKKHAIEITDTPITYTAFFNQIPPFTGEYFNNRDLQGSPVLTRQDKFIDFIWNDRSPDPLLSHDNFSVRWSNHKFFAGGRYKFMTATDDGARLFIDNNLLINKWIDQGGTSYEAVVDLSSGMHDIKMEYYEGGGGAMARLTWDSTIDPITIQLPATTPTPTPVPTITPVSSPSPTPVPSPSPSSNPSVGTYTGSYWNLGADVYNSPILPTTRPDLIRNDPSINFIWNDNSPYPQINTDHFAASWVKQDAFTSGIYRFSATADDGIRVYLDNQLLINQWDDHAVTTYNTEIPVSAGNHIVKVEYYENFGGAIAVFNYSKTKNLDPNFLGEYFDNKNLTGSPKLIRADPKINFVWNNSSPDALISKDQFSIRWAKYQNYIKAGKYRFTLKSDDGIRFWVDDTLLVDDWTDHPMRVYTPSIILSAGIHKLKVEYYENKGGAVAVLDQN